MKNQLPKKLVPLIVVAITIALSTIGCRTSNGSGVKGSRGGIATGVKGTTRAIDPSSDWAGTRFEVYTVRGQMPPLNAGENPDHFVVDTKKDWHPITVRAIFADGQVQLKTINWMINGVGVTAYVGANAGLAAAVGIGSIPSIAGDAITHAAYDLDLPRPHFTHQTVYVAPKATAPAVESSQQTPAPKPACAPSPFDSVSRSFGSGTQPRQAWPVQRSAPTTVYNVIGNTQYGSPGQSLKIGEITVEGGGQINTIKRQ